MRKIVSLAGFVRAVGSVISASYRFAGGAQFGQNQSAVTANVVAGDPLVAGTGQSAVVVGGLRSSSGHGITLVAPAGAGSGQAIRFLSDTGGGFGGVDWYGNLTASSLRVAQFGMSRRDQSSTPYAISNIDQHVVRWTGTGAATFTLPAANSRSGQPFFVFVIDGNGAAGTSNITIQRAGSDTIDGALTSVTIARNHGGRLLMSDGVSRWYTMGGLFS